MAYNKQYKDFLEISPNFESVVDIDADKRNQNLWREYIVGDDMENLVDVLCQSLGNEAPDARRSFWVHGSYGTGKSYAAIFVKHLLEEDPNVIDEFLSKSSRLSKYRNRFMKCRNKGDYLVIWKTGCTGIRTGDMMLVEAEQAVREALVAKFGDKADLGGASLISAVTDRLDDASINWDHVIENTILSDDYSSVEELRAAVSSGKLSAIQTTAMVLRDMKFGLISNLDTFENWLTEVIDANGLAKSGIFFIWDEFTEYVAHSDDHTIMQQLSEFCKVKPFFMLYVVHRSDEMVDSMGKDRYQMITNRFHTVEFHISASAALDLIAGSIVVRNGIQNAWADERNQVVNDFKKFLPDLVGLDDKTGEMIDKLCPIHPMTIRLLSRVAESFAAAQRTMFRFMKDQSNSDIGFVGYINHYGPDDEARWLTPEWLWDYFFTRESDFSDKDTKVAPYIQHYEESLHLVESDEDALRLFKIVMLLLAVSSTTKGAYGVRHMQGGIAATLDCLENCVAGVLSKDKVRDLLATLEESKLVLQDQAANGTIRLQLPFKGGSGDAFRVKFENNDRKYSRYQMFAKDGRFSNELEKKVWDENDATFKRMKIAVCCAETNSINNRLAEVKAELIKSPYKLGLLIVTVKDDPQYSAIQNTLAHAAADANEPRLTIALLKTPLSDENRKAWLTQLTKMDLANESGQTASANGYKLESEKVINTWTAQATGGGKLVAWNGTNVFNNLYGTANLRHTIITQVLNNVFPYAPEQIVKMVTAYKPCNDAAPTAGIARKGATTQMQSVLNSISPEILQFTEIDGIANATGDKTVTAVSALAKVIRDKMDSGQRVILSDLWRELQEPPFGYYNTIACGILLGLILSCYKNTAFSWTDSVQSTHILNEQTLKSMILSMCKGALNSDYLSAGSITFQHFRDYVKDIVKLTDAQVATEAECCRNMRAAITQSGAPFWALKYLPDGTYGPNTDKANTIIDEMQQFISADIDREAIMNDVLLNFQSRGKVKVAMRKAFQDKAVMSTAFRNFLYSSSPALADVATTLSIQPVDLSDRLHLSMQGEIYTWTEQQVVDKLADIVNEYQYLVEVDHALGQNYRNLEDARKDLANRFKYQRIPFTAVEDIQKPWYPALKALRTLSLGKVAHLTADERNADAAALHSYGKSANDFLTDSKPTLADILDDRDVNCTAEELDAIYSGLKSTPFDATLTQFNHLLDQQVARIGQARNRSKLKALWESVTGKESVKAWCDSFSTPIFWVIPKELRKPIHTVIDLQSGITTPRDTEVIAAIDALQNEKARVLTDAQKVYAALYETVGSEYVTYFKVHRPELLAKLKLSHGNDMSTWEAPELSRLQSMMKSAIQQQARQEKLQNTKNEIAEMPVSRLRENIASFLDNHPEYCDEFLK